MNAPQTTRDRMRGVKLITLLLIVSFAFIPVRCDASAAPHSIFVSPTMVGMSHTEHAAMHEHRAMAADTSAVSEKQVPGHDASMTMTEMDHGQARSSSFTATRQTDAPKVPLSVSLRSTLPLARSTTLASGGDPESQQPVGATLDLPITSLTPNSSSLLLQELELLPRAVSAAPVWSGLTVPPEAPPPKTA